MSGIIGNNIVRNGLVLNLDAADRKSYPGSGTAWFDRSGNKNNGTLSNNPSFDNQNGGCFSYNGTDSSVFFGDVLDLTSTNISGFSWVNITTFKDFTAIIDKLASGGNYRLHVNANQYVAFGIRNTAGTFEGYSTPILSANTWYYLGFTHNISTKVSKIFINGVLKSSFTHSIDRGDTTSNLTLGYASNNTVFGNFKQATVSIYNRELTNTEIQQNFNATRKRFNI
jgi:hypothetical protein